MIDFIKVDWMDSQGTIWKDNVFTSMLNDFKDRVHESGGKVFKIDGKDVI